MIHVAYGIVLHFAFSFYKPTKYASPPADPVTGIFVIVLWYSACPRRLFSKPSQVVKNTTTRGSESVILETVNQINLAF